jgi:hypothetical protein
MRRMLQRVECSCHHAPSCAAKLFQTHGCFTSKEKVNFILTSIRGEAMRRGAPARAAGKTLLSTRESIAACKKAAWMQQLEDIISGALELLPGSEGGRRDRSPAVYLLAGVMVCRSALTALYGTNTRTFGRKLALQRDEGTAGFLLPTHPGGGAGDLRRQREVTSKRGMKRRTSSLATASLTPAKLLSTK